ncbi:hypothetical protein PPL_06963 [Heterostelium album PN500]|uniref:SHSP domain-containing protein n=1 Tax=Heterostelium pallidum (strain ATCC 26659 / Pp 5 / PN500) TaxID=670386 RepID=D3BE10_HETP5|nr:hypothetical protein PPL_06963 [Heterostelium album PN500]EFA80141.1 hypothetical protein PPL_06963 [Heterostelium album PN500]|eukprot:XP_020432261.1 hypothetical protein PPL_06963 [Heterostelium album PN500]
MNPLIMRDALEDGYPVTVVDMIEVSYNHEFQRDVKEFKENMKQMAEEFKEKHRDNMHSHSFWWANRYTGGDHGHHGKPLDHWFGGGRSEESFSSFSPKTRVEETGNSFEVEVELPGIKKNDVKITFSKDTLIIASKEDVVPTTPESSTANSEQPTTTTSNNATKSKSTKRFQKEIQFFEPVSFEKISARMEDGVLYVTVPKEQIDHQVSIL